MTEKLLAQIAGLGQSDQRLVFGHLLDLSSTPAQRHLQTELIERGFFKWDFFTANSKTPLPSSSPSPSSPGLSRKSFSRAISKSFSRTSSSSTSPSGYSASVLDSGGLDVDSAPVSSSQQAAQPLQDPNLEAIKEIWKTFNTSDEVGELEEKGAKSKSHNELYQPIRRLGQCCVLLLMLYRSVQMVQSIIEESRVSMEEILDKGAVLAFAKQQQQEQQQQQQQQKRPSSASFSSSPPGSGFGFDHTTNTQFSGDTNYTQFAYDSDHTHTPLFSHVEDKKGRAVSMSFSGSPQGKNSPFYFDAFGSSSAPESLPPLPSSPGNRSVSHNPANPFSNGQLATLPAPLTPNEGAPAASPTVSNPEKAAAAAAAAAADAKGAAALQKLRATADERYRVFVTTCATLLSQIPEERVFKPMFDEQVGNTMALAQSVQKYLNFVHLQSKPSMKERMEKVFNSPSSKLWQRMNRSKDDQRAAEAPAAAPAPAPVVLPWKEDFDAEKKKRGLTTAGRIQSRPALPMLADAPKHFHPTVIEADMHFVPVLTLTPATNFHPEVVMKSGKRISIGRKVNDEPAPADVKLFNSKVVSRSHAEIWFSGGTFMIRDLRSTSGTFLNAMRLSEAGKESRPFKIVTGDVLQFGVDLKGSFKEEEKCLCALVTVRKVPISLKKLCIREVRNHWHRYSDKMLQKIPLPLEREILSIE